MKPEELVCSETAAVWELLLEPREEQSRHTLYLPLGTADLTRYLYHKKICSFCHGNRGVCQHRMVPWISDEPGSRGCQPRIACPNCMGRETARDDITFIED
ncbi:hypothetical protein CALVIDRAFT_536749 [Calocera viscosa TUFC12733]|uniref:Uncharacterized protein n=1 Tax=Calocera viscosa (strain TUFC12733) TaxID=1330018 RepID=A0A167ML29_CALVF|nr:hypothetical protein CALVIDRAFT_536749 [Calocera viscosa TUFC12733]